MKAAIQSLPNTLRRTMHFLRLLLWDYPFRREPVEETRTVTNYYYTFVVVGAAMGVLFGPPRIAPNDFPNLEQATLIEGRVIRHPTIKGGKYTSEPFGVETAAGPVFKQCTRLGVHCLEPDYWARIEGHPARMWFWRDWVVQVEVDGVVPERLTYFHKRKMLIDFGGMWIFGGWVAISAFATLVRLLRRYGRAAANESFETKPTTPYSGMGEMK